MCCEYQSSKADLREIETHTTRNTYLRTHHHTTTPRTQLIDIEYATLGSVYVYFDGSSLQTYVGCFWHTHFFPRFSPPAVPEPIKPFGKWVLRGHNGCFLFQYSVGSSGRFPGFRHQHLKKAKGREGA